MDNLDPDAATQEVEEPVGGAEPGSEPENKSGGTDLTPEAFKGLQRRLSAKDRENAELRRQVEDIARRNQSGGLSDPNTLALIRPLLQKLNETDPEFARQYAAQLRDQMLERENQELKARLSNQDQIREAEEAERRNMNELRALARDLGANPDSPLIDYGDSTMWIHERMSLVRETAKEAAKPVNTPATPAPTVSNGQNHNPNPGVPPSPKPQAASYTQEDYSKALAAYREHPCSQHMQRAQEIKNAMVSALEKELPDPYS